MLHEHQVQAHQAHLLLLQDRAQAVETQLANTMQELEKVKAHQQQLEAKNLLLEKVQSMRKDSIIQCALSDVSFLAAELSCAVFVSILSCNVGVKHAFWHVMV